PRSTASDTESIRYSASSASSIWLFEIVGAHIVPPQTVIVYERVYSRSATTFCPCASPEADVVATMKLPGVGKAGDSQRSGERDDLVELRTSDGGPPRSR